jgi:sugar lactone lactonase YvrE
VTVIAHIPSPGFPALPHVVGNLIYEGTYDNPAGDSIPSHVFQFSGAGKLLKTFIVKGQDLSQAHGIQVAATDALGRLILLDKTSGRILQLNPKTGVQDTYATVADLPTCSADGNKPPCSPAVQDLAPMPDYAVWGPDGSLYVTDYQQAVIWRIPPHGGSGKVWLADKRLDGNIFGTASIALLPDHHTLLFDQASNAGLGGGNPTTGKLYSVQITANGTPGPLHQLWESQPAEAPDGFAIARSGHIYMALVGFSNQVVEIDANGHEITRFGQQYSGTNNSTVPFDSPSGVAFFGTQLVIANQSYITDTAANQALLGLQTGELGQPTLIPVRAGLRPGEKLPVKRKHRRRRHRRRR